jgi:hypothetical protein
MEPEEAEGARGMARAGEQCHVTLSLVVLHSGCVWSPVELIVKRAPEGRVEVSRRMTEVELAGQSVRRLCCFE